MKINKTVKIKLKVAIFEKIWISRSVGLNQNESDFMKKFVVLVGCDPLTEGAPGNFCAGDFVAFNQALQFAKYYAEENGYKLLVNRSLVGL